MVHRRAYRAAAALVAVAAAGWGAGQADPDFDFAGLQPEKVAGGFVFTEGPVWVREGYLLFSDTRSDRIHRYAPASGVTVWREPSGRTNGNTVDALGRIYHCEVGRRRLTRTGRDGGTEVLMEHWEGKRLNSPNDVVVRRDGHIYFTDPAFSTPPAERELDFFGIYHIDPSGRAELAASWRGRPNGIALSPNGRTLYVANTDDRSIRTFAVDAEGRVSGENTLVSPTDGPPDGIRVDVRGNIYVAATGISVYSPSGKARGVIRLPEMPSNCAFGDADLRTLYITARTSLYRVRLPFPGAVSY